MATSTKDTGADKVFNVVNYVLLFSAFLLVLYPLVYILSASFSDAAAVISGQVWLWPVRPSLLAYETVFRDSTIVTGFMNSVFYTVVGTVINVVLTLLAAYPLSRKDLWGRNGIMFFFFFTLLFSGGLIPTYLVVRDLGLLDTRWALILPAALSVWNVIITRTYFQITIPQELLEAARIDGCDDFRFFLQIVLPLSPPIIAVNVVFYAVGHWNEFFDALIYLTKPALFPLQLFLRNILAQNQNDLTMTGDVADMLARANLAALLKYALVVVATVPMLILYVFAQRHYVRGLMIGSIKG